MTISYSHNKRPVIIGIGQCVHRSLDPAEIKTPMELIEMAVHAAEADSHVKTLAQKVDTLCLVNILTQQYNDPLSEFTARINIKPKHQSYTWVGACAPQWFVNQAVEKIISGKARIALICGGEAFHSRKIDARAKGTIFQQWDFSRKKAWMAGDLRDPITELEMKYGLTLPINFYPFFENALRHHEGLTVEEHKKELGEFCAGMSKISAGNLYSWFQTPKTADEIPVISESNPMVSFPYTKFLCSMMQVDQAAAIFLTDEQTASELGVPKEKWVYPVGGGDASDVWHVSERVNFYSSPSAGVAADTALAQAGVSLDQVDCLDLYSCFPCATRIVRNMLGIDKNDPRDLTVTGGMSCFGGPGNNYSMHAICKMVELIRQDKDRIGLVHSLSWFISKHSVGVYSGYWRQADNRNADGMDLQGGLDKIKEQKVVEKADGNGEIETYTIFHDRNSRPIDAVIIGKLADGSRFLAKPEPNSGILADMMKNEFIGRKGRVDFKDGFNVFCF
jgi:acetyl-CoA C-acetyltransferase